MTRDDILAFLRTQKLGVVSSVNVAGAPQSAVVGYAVSDAFELVFDTLGDTRKALNLRARVDEIYAKHTGKPVEQVHDDMERDRFFTSEQAAEYGLIDQVLRTGVAVVRRSVTVPEPRNDVSHLGVTVSPMFDEERQLHGAICLFTDLTAVKDLDVQVGQTCSRPGFVVLASFHPKLHQRGSELLVLSWTGPPLVHTRYNAAVASAYPVSPVCCAACGTGQLRSRRGPAPHLLHCTIGT